MNESTMGDMIESLWQTCYVIEAPEEVRERAAQHVERVIAIG